MATGRGDAAAAAWKLRGDGSRRRRGCHVDIPRRCVLHAAPKERASPRRRLCRDVHIPWRHVEGETRLHKARRDGERFRRRKCATLHSSNGVPNGLLMSVKSFPITAACSPAMNLSYSTSIAATSASESTRPSETSPFSKNSERCASVKSAAAAAARATSRASARIGATSAGARAAAAARELGRRGGGARAGQICPELGLCDCLATLNW